MPDEPKAPHPDDRDLDELSDEELAVFEASLQQAAAEHRIEIDAYSPAPSGLDASDPLDEEEADRKAAELERRIEEIAAASRGREERDEEDRATAGHPDPQVEETLKRLESVAAQARTRKNVGLHNETNQRKQDREAAMGAGLGMSVAFSIIGLPLFGLLIGKLIDGGSGRTTWANALVLVGAGVGVAFAVYQLNRYSNRND